MTVVDPSILREKFKPIDKTSLSEEISRQIMRLVSSGDLKPGQRLPSERELCTRFGVGRSSPREALRCLTIVGVLEGRVGEGTFLALNNEKFIGTVLGWRVATEHKNVANLIKARIALESENAANAALNSSQESVDELEVILKKMTAALKDRLGFAAADAAFHLAIAKASNNELVFDLLTLIRSQLEQTLLRVAPRSGDSLQRTSPDSRRHSQPRCRICQGGHARPYRRGPETVRADSQRTLIPADLNRGCA